MSNSHTSAKILDFNAYRERRIKSTDATPVSNDTPVQPMLMWYPVWVMVPQQFPNT